MERRRSEKISVTAAMLMTAVRGLDDRTFITNEEAAVGVGCHRSALTHHLNAFYRQSGRSRRRRRATRSARPQSLGRDRENRMSDNPGLSWPKYQERQVTEPDDFGFDPEPSEHHHEHHAHEQELHERHDEHHQELHEQHHAQNMSSTSTTGTTTSANTSTKTTAKSTNTHLSSCMTSTAKSLALPPQPPRITTSNLDPRVLLEPRMVHHERHPPFAPRPPRPHYPTPASP